MFNYNINSLSFSIDGENLTTTMLCMLFGIFIASAYTAFIKKFRGEFVLALIEAGAFSKESAKSLSELGIKKNFLRSISVNTRFFFSPDYFSLPASNNSEETKYYINEEAVDRLQAKYGNSGITFIQLLITVIAFLAVALILATAVPGILNMFNF